MYNIHRIKNKKTLKALMKFRLRYGHVPLSSDLWMMIYKDIVLAEGEHIIVSDCEKNVFVVEGTNTATNLINAPPAVRATFPKELNEILDFAKKDGEWNKKITERLVIDDEIVVSGERKKNGNSS